MRRFTNSRTFSISAPPNTKLLSSPNQESEEVDRMRQRFLLDTSTRQRATWSALWQEQITPWDLGGPTPALISELSRYFRNPSPPPLLSSGPATSPVTTTLRTLVPGCGAGYDLVTLARHHDDLIARGLVKHAFVVGLDLAEASLHRAAEQLQASLEFFPFERPTRVDLVRGDFFETHTWETLCTFGTGDEPCPGLARPLKKDHPSDEDDHHQRQQHFDLIFDYTFFCALPPALRKDWGQRMAQLLQPETGQLLTLMFPMNNGESDNADPPVGPPYPVRVADYRQVLEPWGVQVAVGPHENADTVKPRAGRELACWWRKSATREPGDHSARPDGTAKL